MCFKLFIELIPMCSTSFSHTCMCIGFVKIIVISSRNQEGSVVVRNPEICITVSLIIFCMP